MIYKVIISETAQRDIKDIYEYIAFVLQSPENAGSQVTRIEKSILGLNQFPQRFRLYGKKTGLNENVRFMPVDNYLVFYEIDFDNTIVNVLRVVYGKRKTEKI